jgi:hypothetical protein
MISFLDIKHLQIYRLSDKFFSVQYFNIKFMIINDKIFSLNKNHIIYQTFLRDTILKNYSKDEFVNMINIHLKIFEYFFQDYNNYIIFKNVFLKYYNVSHEKNMLSNIGKYYIINNKIDQFNAISNVKIIQNFNEKKLYYSPIVKNEILPSLIIKIDENKKKHLLLKKNKKNKIKSCEDYYIYIKNEKEVFRVEVDNFSRKIKNNDDFFEIINKTNILFSFSDKYSVMFEDFSNIIYEISPKCKIILNNKFVSNDQKYWESFKRLKIHNNVNFENINSYMNYIETLIENDSIDTCFTIVLKISSESDIYQLIKSLYISD